MVKLSSYKKNNDEFDYGPTVVLEHNINPKVKFYTLYGHLSKKCMKSLSIGKKIKEGVEFAEIGNYPANGNWSPHLHFQIIIDLMRENKKFSWCSRGISMVNVD